MVTDGPGYAGLPQGYRRSRDGTRDGRIVTRSRLGLFVGAKGGRMCVPESKCGLGAKREEAPCVGPHATGVGPGPGGAGAAARRHGGVKGQYDAVAVVFVGGRRIVVGAKGWRRVSWECLLGAGGGCVSAAASGRSARRHGSPLHWTYRSDGIEETVVESQRRPRGLCLAHGLS